MQRIISRPTTEAIGGMKPAEVTHVAAGLRQTKRPVLPGDGGSYRSNLSKEVAFGVLVWSVEGQG